MCRKIVSYAVEQHDHNIERMDYQESSSSDSESPQNVGESEEIIWETPTNSVDESEQQVWIVESEKKSMFIS